MKSPYTDDNMRDRYGHYYLLTGLEEKGRCFWCGINVTHGRRYCSQEHHDLYHEHFCWPAASSACLKRQGRRCGDCGKEAKLLVHHKQPLDGSLRLWNILNRPENLIGLCASCHGKRHAELNGHVEREDRYQAAIKAGQLELVSI